MLYSLLAGTLLGNVTLSTNVSAAEIAGNKNNIINTPASKSQKAMNDINQEAIQDIDQKVNKMIDSIPPIFGSKYTLTDRYYGESLTYSGINLKENNSTNVEPMYFGSNTFYNDTELEQSYNTTSFSESVTKSTTTQTQNGFKSGVTTGGKVGIPFVAEGEVKINLEYNFTHTNSNTISKTTTLTAPPQAVKVPAGKVYKSDVYFEKKSTSGTVELYGDFLTGVVAEGRTTSIGNVLHQATDKQGLIQSPNDPNKVRAIGKGTFNVEHGSNFIVKTYDVTSGQKSVKLVDTKIIPIK
ncbi:ETX/MTX2 family pore-forming toxin [Bacillus bombysepticus]|uniref:ETX/MTX2 family pore-forming toxin n=1 Tax=Bacillus bombysepticus TaxID=658666 RepID=UPI003019ED9B